LKFRAGHGIRTRLRGLGRIHLFRAMREKKPFEVAVGRARLPEVAVAV
jgi:hypothetical protein